MLARSINHPVGKCGHKIGTPHRAHFQSVGSLVMFGILRALRAQPPAPSGRFALETWWVPAAAPRGRGDRRRPAGTAGVNLRRDGIDRPALPARVAQVTPAQPRRSQHD
jgi:hypothetical protein